MRITEVNISEEHIRTGLKPITMKKLGQVVMIAGKNGSGKTRLLGCIKSTLTSFKPTIKKVESAKRSLHTLEEELIKNKTRLNNLKPNNEFVTQDDIHQSIAQIEKQIDELKKIITWIHVVTDQLGDRYDLMHDYIPKELDFKEAGTFSKHALNEAARESTSVSINSLSKNTIASMQHLQNKWMESTNPNSTVSDENKKKNIGSYENLKRIVNKLLSTDIGRNEDLDILLFNQSSFNYTLSDGQKILLQLCVALHAQGNDLDENILVLDEPENHLHPEVAIEVIQKIIDAIPNGQIWIATHSIPILAAFGPDNIWYMDEGEISYVGKKPEKVLRGLVGDDEQVSKLHDFLSLPAQYAINQYAYECLFHPDTVTTGKNDKQGIQIRKELGKHLEIKDKIRILDFGAGKGRLLDNIIQNNIDSLEALGQSTDYVAYDKFSYDRELCLAVLKQLYDDHENRYFNKQDKLFAQHDKETFDIVIMCNVFHEIPPSEWNNIFSKGDIIQKSLTENGIVMIVEDQAMPVGEKAYQNGFIVLDTQELKDLFSVKNGDIEILNFDDEDRLKTHIIKKKDINISSDSKKAALESIQKKATDKIKEIRKRPDIGYKNGREHAFWSQQFTNASLCLTELG